MKKIIAIIVVIALAITVLMSIPDFRNVLGKIFYLQGPSSAHDHSFSGWEIITPATHTKEGEEIGYCECGETKTQAIDKFAKHTFGEWVVTTPATHTAEGVETRRCECGATETQSIAKIADHSFGNWTVTTPATHTAEGVETRRCECGATETQSIAKIADHSFGNWTVTTPATHMAEGVETGYCECGATETRSIAKIADHTFENWTVTTPAAHTAEGVETGYCACGETAKRSIAKTTEHTYDDWEITTPATHLAEGVETGYCECGETAERPVAKIADHTFAYWTVTIPATHTTEGVKTRRCACGETQTQPIDKIAEHTFENWRVITLATHLTEGEEIGYCECGETKTQSIAKIAEHTFVDWTVTTPATHMTEGVEFGSCECGETTERPVAKTTEHTFTNWTVTTLPTHMEEGVELGRCECGETDERPVAKTTEHTFTNWIVTTFPTHMEEGVELGRCECGATSERSVAKTIEHTFTNWTVTTLPTHMTEGVETGYCECGETDEAPVAKTTEHTFVDWTVTTPATHLTEGVETGRCECGETSERPSAKIAEHTFVDWTVTKAATHIEEGVETGYCECGETYGRPIAKTTEHTFVDWTVTKTATHMAEGVETGYCACGETDEKVIARITEHTFVDWAVTTPATHLAEGVETGYCECGETDEKSIPKTTKHTFTNWAVTTPATHLAEGVETGYCACGETETRTIEKISKHTYGEWNVTTPATHLAEGVETRVCECGASQTQAIEKIPEHTFGEWEEVTSATCTAKGKKARECECGKVETEELDMLPHNQDGNIPHKDATCTETGVVGGDYCTDCNYGKEAAQKDIAKIPHNQNGSVLHKDATCTETGVVGGTYCTDCGYNKEAVNKIIDKVPHNTKGNIAHLDPTCTETGMVGGTYCTACGKDKAEAEAIIPATEHNQDGYIEPITETCTENGRVGGTYCTVCNYGKANAEAVIPAFGHNQNGNVPHKDATCTDTGVVGGKYCTTCGYNKEAVETTIAMLPHNERGNIAHLDATCLEDGIVGGTYCTACGEGKEEAETVIPAAGHNQNGNIDHVNATCTTPGKVGGKYCTVCNNGKAAAETVIPATGHSYGDWEETTPATHMAAGELTRSCACGEKQTQAISKISEHNYSDWEVTKAATHLTTGVKTRSCECGATETQSIDKTPEHTYGEWVEITAATCTKAGEKSRECECGKVETEEIAILDHNQDGNITHVEATCTEPGVVGGNYCTACGYGKAAAQTVIPATGHTWTDATCTAPKTCSVCTITAGEPIAHQIGDTGVCGGCGENFKRTITFQNGNTGNATMPASISGIIGEDIPLLTTPKLSNYNFGGWYTDKACTIPFTATTFSEDMTLYAKWTAITSDPITILSLNADNSGSLGDTAKVKKAVSDAGNPDIVCLQYVGAYWLNPPANYTNQISGYTLYFGESKTQNFIMFFKTDKFERVDGDTAGCYMYAVLKRKSDNALLAVINAYFNNSPSVAEETRNNQLNELWGGINEIRSNHGLIPMIITGSINATPTDSNVYQGLTESSVFFDTSSIAKNSTPGNTYTPNGGSIRDYILVSNHMQYAVESYKVDVNGHNYNTLIAKIAISKVTCAHKPTRVAGVEATCSATGSKETYVCSTCGKLFADKYGTVELTQADRVIPALGHTYGEGVVTAPTCETNGYTSYTCSVCGYVHTDSEIPAIGHAWTNNCDTECNNSCGTTREVTHDYEWVIDTAPTFIARGVKHEECTVCHDVRNENTPINKLTCTHTLSKTEAVPATCLNAGNKEYYTCSICNKVYANAEGTLETTVADCVIAALGHAINNEGTCNVCGKNFVRTIKFANADGVSAISGIVGERINLPTPKKAGYSFAGWYTDSDCTTPFAGTTFSENLTLYANWVPNNTSEQITILSYYANSSRSTNNNTTTPQAILQANNPSIICLQNAGDTWLSISLSGYLNGYAASPQNSSAPLVNDGDSNGCNLIFYRKDTFTAVSGSDGWVYIGSTTHYATYIVLQHKDGTYVAVINAWFDNSTDEATRNAQLQDLLSKINAIWSSEGYGSMPMVITSSFGDDKEPNASHIYQGLTQNNLFVDASTAAKSTMGAADRGDDVFVSYHLQYAVESYEILTHRNTSYPILIKVTLPKAACAHKLEKTEATNATCTTIGNKEYYTCSSCGKVYIDAMATMETTLEERTIYALGHTEGRIAHLDATCTETGVVGGTYCTVCNNGKEEAEEIIPATGHNQDGNIDHVDATCAKEGVVGGIYCTACEYDKAAAAEPIEKLPHNEDGNVTHKDATCAEEGVVGGTYCTACGYGKEAAETIIEKLPHNEDGNVTHRDATCAEEGVVGGTYCTACGNGQDAAEAIIEKLPHSNNGNVTHKDATCTEEGVVGGIYCTACGNGQEEAEAIIEKLAHNERGIIAHVEPTCTEDGVVGGTYCTVCNYNKDVAGAVIPATGHNQNGNVAHVDATCTQTGIVGGTFCTVCKYGKSAAEAIIEKAPHNKNGNIAHVDATCTEEGIVGGTYCTDCDYGKAAAQATIEKLAHNERGVIAHVDATCTEEGIVGGKYCTVCKYNKEAAEAAIEKLPHNYEWKVDIEPTFDTEGVKHEECTVCHNTRNVNTPVDKLSCAHNLTKTEATAATCLTAGNKEYYTCSMCGEVYLNAEGTLKTTAEDCIIAALGHTFGEWVVTTPTTHIAEGVETAYCACGETKTRTIDKIAKHTYGDWKVTTPATHTQEGEETRSCECGATQTQVIDKITEHAFGEWKTTTPATHMTEGEETRSCECGATQTQTIDKISEHSFVNWKVTTPATHTVKGIETATCECGASQTRTIDKIAEHTFGEWKVTSLATHTVAGVQTRYCECGETETEMIDKIAEHSFGEWKVTLPTSHIAEGVKTRYCECGETQTQTIDKTPEHTFGKWVEITPATCTTEGEKARYCECGEFEEEVIAIVSHNKNGNILHKDATCEKPGVVGGTFCTACNKGKEAAETVIPATGHKWVAATCTAPKTCSVCKVTEGGLLEHQIGNTGICGICGQSFIKTVKFLSGNINTGTQLAEPVSGLPGEKIPFPAPQMSNYKITGWYLDAACTKLFTGTTFSENLTLYAKWISNPAEQITVLSYHGNGSGWTNDDGPTKKAIEEAGYPDVISLQKMGSGWKTLGIANYTASSQNAKTERFITYYKTNKFTEIDSGYTTYYSYTVLKRTSDETLFVVINVLFESGTEETKLNTITEGINSIWNKHGIMPTIIVGNFGSATTTDSVAYKGLIANSQFVDTSKVATSITGAANTDKGHYAFASYHMQSSVTSYKVLTERNGKDPVLVTVALPKACALIRAEATEATCLTMGNKEYYYCSVCGKIYLDAMGTREVTAADCMIPALGHDWKEATCSAPKTCSGCGLTEGVALDHVWTNACDTTCDNNCGTTRTVKHDYEWVIDTPPTVTTEGVKHEECTVCHAKRSENTPVDKLACTHALIKTAATAATCTSTGNKEYYTCSICNKVYADAEGILETTVENCKTAVLDHTWAKATCNTPKTCSVCDATEGEALGHSWKEATCTAPRTCSVCGATAGEPIAHNINEASICTICGEYFLRKINFKGGKLSSGTYAYDNAQIAASVYGLVGESFSYPEITLQLKGYNFDGWCTDYACTKPFTGTTFSEDMTLYAKWVSNANQIVSIMSFNVKVTQWDEYTSNSRANLVINTIRSSNPDVFGVQEADSTWMERLTNAFEGTYTIVGDGRDSSRSGEHCAIFFRTSMFNLVDCGTKWLSNTPDVAGSVYSYKENGKTYSSNYPRIMTYVVLQRKTDGAKFLYVNAHLDNNGTDHDETVAEKIRKAEIDIMMNIIKNITKTKGDIPVVITGDFNSIPGKSTYAHMTQTCGYSDSSRIAKEGGPSTTFTDMSNENSGTILDYIFVSSHLKNMVETYTVCPAKRDGKWVSDHNAIIAKIAIPKTN